MTYFRIGDRVVKNLATWQPSEFDAWGSGDGVGTVVGIGLTEKGTMADVRWIGGRSTHEMDELCGFDRPMTAVPDSPSRLV